MSAKDNRNGATLGIEAYASDDTPAADLLKNLEGCRVHRFSEGTGVHAGTALMAVELPDGDGLGVQVSMEEDTSDVEVHPDIQQNSDGGWSAEPDTEYRTLDKIEEPCPNCRIIEVVQRDIMDPENARVLAIIQPESGEPYAIDIHLDESGGTEFFGVEL